MLPPPFQSCREERVAGGPATRSESTNNRTGSTSEGERGRNRGVTAPRTGESHILVAASSRDAGVVVDVLHRHGRTALRLGSVPQLGDSLAVGERPAQCPAVDRRRAGVVYR